MPSSDLPLFHFAQSYKDSNQFYLTQFLCPDPFAVLELPGGRAVAAVSAMEHGRAERESTCEAVEVLTRRKGGPPESALTAFLKKHRADRIRVLPSFPVGLARFLESEGFSLEIDGTSVSGRRRRKSAREIELIQNAQRSTERAMETARLVLAGCTVKKSTLEHDGQVLTAQRLRGIVEVFLLDEGFESMDTITAPGKCGADPHEKGIGPIRAGVPIVMDLFPRDKVSRYHSDMSRTFVVGKASGAAREMHAAVAEAQDAAIDRLKPGVSLASVHDAVCDVFRARGYPVPSTPGKVLKRGFLHSTGHGLGLDVHEAPSVSSEGDELKAGDVITIEPGLYDRRVGGIRIEDVIAVMPDGSVRNLTRFDRELEIL